MAKLTEKDMEELREACAYGCEYSGTQEIVAEIAQNVLTELAPCNIYTPDEIALLDGDDDSIGTLEDFIRMFWDKAVEKILNVASTQ